MVVMTPAEGNENAIQLQHLSKSHDTAGDRAPPDNGFRKAAPAAIDDEEIRGSSKEEEQGQTISKDAEDERAHLTGVPLALLVFCLCLITFVVTLDNTIIATAIPYITSVFNSLPDVGWYGSAYLLTTTALQPTFGRIYTFFNVKWTFVSAILIFELGSTLCATSTSSVMFIIGRAIAGIGGAALYSGGLTILGLVVPLRKRALYSGLMTSMFGVSAVVGPLLGGAFTDKVSWRWCFWINLPFGAVGLLAVLFIFKVPPSTNRSSLSIWQKLARIDLVGAFFLIPGIICLLLALQWGGTTYPWSNSKVWGCLLGFALIIAVFVVLQIRRGDEATIPPRVFMQRTVLASCAFLAFLNMGMLTHFYYLPFYFQVVRGTSAVGSGVHTVPYIISLTLASILGGGAITLVGWYVPFMLWGSAAFTVGAGLLQTMAVGTPQPRWIGYQIVAGIGSGLAIQTPYIAVQRVVIVNDLAIGNALTSFFNSCGAAIGIAAAQNIFVNALARALRTNVPQLNPQVIIDAGATHIRNVSPPELLPEVILAYNYGVTQSFILAIATGGLAFLCAFFVEWKSVKDVKEKDPAGASGHAM